MNDDFMNDFEQTTNEIISIIDKDPTKEGCDAALKHLSANKARLKEKYQKNLGTEDGIKKYGMFMGKINARFQDLEKKYPAIKKDIDYVGGQALMFDH
jgi:hypothetical protein